MSEYGNKYSVSKYLFSYPENHASVTAHVAEEVERMEKEILYQAYKDNAKQNKNVVISLVTKESQNPISEYVDFFVLAKGTPVEENKVYVPIFAGYEMPQEVWLCEWCSGYTKNDNKGNCGACGAPRQRLERGR